MPFFWQHGNCVECPECHAVGTYTGDLKHLSTCEIFYNIEVGFLQYRHASSSKSVDEAYEKNR